MSQNERNKICIATILRQMGELTYPDIALRGGEGLASALMEMVQEGVVVRKTTKDTRTVFSLTKSIY